MDIIYLGHSSFRISSKLASVVTDPYKNESTGLKFPKVSSTIVTVSHNHDDHNNTSDVSDVKKVISGPGEYEIEGISIIGIPSFHDELKGAERGKNVIYVIEVEGFRIAHLGDLGHKLTDEQGNMIGEIDILMIPVGGVYTIGPQEAVIVVQTIEPKIIIPMHYQTEGLNKEIFGSLSSFEAFESAIGLKARQEKKLTIKPDSILPDDQEIIVLEKS